MISQEEKEIIEQTTKTFIEKMGFQITRLSIVNTEPEKEGQEEIIKIKIESPDSKFIIGKKGNTLMAIQHLLRVILSPKIKSKIISVDVNNYKEEHINYLKNIANEMAQEVILNGRATTMEPMNSYERYLIHLELKKNKQVKTESIGQGEDRKIVISPA